jgi:acetolactate synthase-1/3 small subunit
MDKAIFALVNNEPEVLMRVTGFLRRLGFNIKSISMSETVSDSSLAHLTIKTEEENQRIERVINNIEKFINVHAVKKIENFTLFSKSLDNSNMKAKEACLYELLGVTDELDPKILNRTTFKNTGTNGVM